LVVDDFVTNLDVAANFLRKYNLHVDCAASGYEAIEHITNGERKYDAVFMDQMMPELDGTETTERIRALGTDYAKNVPIIAVTANANAENAPEFLEQGFTDVLSKPINILNLDAVIRKWIMRE
jgi:CheY-like chemotaxis protein